MTPFLGLSKKLSGLAKNKDCQVVAKWLPSIKNHIYWTATSSETGPEKVAKWKSLANHIQNVHTHEDPLFPKCAHPDQITRDPSKWFKPGYYFVIISTTVIIVFTNCCTYTLHTLYFVSLLCQVQWHFTKQKSC